MTIARYNWSMSGTGAHDHTWETSGNTEINPGQFDTIMGTAMIETFEMLTQGKAVYGKPGVGCYGPYRIKRFLIEEQ